MKKTWLVHKGKKPGTFKFNRYNTVKQDFKKMAINVIKETGFVPVEACYFAYLVVETKRNRDPSNFCASAIKFAEDSLTEAGVIPNDGWNQVLGINTYWRHEPDGIPGVFLVMTDLVIMPCTMNELYERYKVKESLSAT